MTRLNISLDGIVPPDLPDGADSKLLSHKYYLDRLGEALASPRGIKLTFGSQSEAEGQRFKYYRARRYVSRQGITSFDRLTLIIDGPNLLIKKDFQPEVEML